MIARASVDQGLTLEGTVRTYTCDLRTVTEGDRKITCLESGLWSSTDLYCRRQSMLTFPKIWFIFLKFIKPLTPSHVILLLYSRLRASSNHSEVYDFHREQSARIYPDVHLWPEYSDRRENVHWMSDRRSLVQHRPLLPAYVTNSTILS